MQKQFWSLLLAAFSLGAQAPRPTTLLVEVDNFVEYLGDTDEVMKHGTDPNITTPRLPNTLFPGNLIGDIVAVNGQPAKGFVIHNARAIGATPTETPGRVIADVTRGSNRQQYIEILMADGTQVGTIFAVGMQGGQLPPGTPTSMTNAANFAIIGGTGAFLGVRGQAGQAAQIRVARIASVQEDPSRRRINGGGRIRFALTFYPMAYPAVLNSNGSPAIAHASDFNSVSATRPAAAGEILALFASGLGPTRPSVDWGTPFPVTPVSTVNSPIEVFVNGAKAEVLGAVGYPGAVDGYQVNFRVPADATKGTASVIVSSAWTQSAAVNIAIQ
jgi:hypothetical protein